MRENIAGVEVVEQQVQLIVKKYYGLVVDVKKLHGEVDLNFLLTDDLSRKYVLKVSGPDEVLENIFFQNSIIRHVKAKQITFDTPDIVPTLDDDLYLQLEIDGRKRFFRLLTWVEGRVFFNVNPKTPALLTGIGEMCAALCHALKDFDHPYAHRFIKWDPSQGVWTRSNQHLFEGEQSDITRHFIDLFTRETLERLQFLPMAVNYNDANDYNIIVRGELHTPEIGGIIDFGDSVYTHRINELAIAIAYGAMDKIDPLEAVCHIVKGFNSKFTIEEIELRELYSLVAMRLVISVTAAAQNARAHEDNTYLQISNKPAWDLLCKWKKIHPDFAWFAFRSACGFSACPQRIIFDEWLKGNGTIVSPVSLESHEVWIDLSVGSLELGNSSTFSNVNVFSNVIAGIKEERNTSVLLGRYDEARAIYNNRAFEVERNDGTQRRTIHLGTDFFSNEGTSVKAVLDGVIHSVKNNDASHDYGPTIIIEHRVSDELKFYTLYGHLSSKVLHQWSAGDHVSKGTVLGTIGSSSENGHWPTHLHFQVILNLFGMNGDFPGVALPEERSLWTNICPDPWMLLAKKPTPQKWGLSNNQIVAYRKKHLGKNMSISYKQPLKIERGHGTYLIDDVGQKYLDTVNNVAHVGHEHPRIVRAGQRQLAVLNTNTRYLHENLVLFVEEVLATMPPSLNVAYIVNSGSEANELAMRLAKNYTGQEDMIVSEIGYHGNTNACVAISSYKFDGPGGKGKTPNVHVVPLPDTYRGIYRGDDLRAGLKYANHVDDAITTMATENKRPAALIFESVISCGGQVELPDGFLKHAYASTRAAGGVCVADEVQTGCGRAGKYFWAFQQHDVVPDIVTIGKPIGNGHPLGVVVTTQAIADAFNNGMEYFNTFGGNPVSCAIGLEVLRVIREEKLQQNADAVGKYLKHELRDLMKHHPIIGDVRGPGLFLGVDLVIDHDTRKPATLQASYFANRMKQKGILMSTDGPFNNVLKIKPPITFSMHNADFLLESMHAVLKEDFLVRIN